MTSWFSHYEDIKKPPEGWDELIINGILTKTKTAEFFVDLAEFITKYLDEKERTKKNHQTKGRPFYVSCNLKFEKFKLLQEGVQKR